MAKMIGTRRRRPRAALIVTLLACLVGFSLAVRWFGFGARFARNEEPPFQIEVLNGTKETGIAMETAKELRRMRIDVLIVDNAERLDFKESVLVDRRGNPKLIRRLAKLLGCRVVLEQLSPAPLVDASYIIGYDQVARHVRG